MFTNSLSYFSFIHSSRTLTETELLERVVNIQYNWIDGQLNELKRRAKSSSKKLTASSTLLATMGHASEEDPQHYQTTSDEQLYQQLTEKQQEFLKSNEINGEVLDNLIKRLNVLLFKSEMRQIEEQSNDPKISSLLKKLETLSLGPSSAFRSNSDTRGELARGYM